LLVLQLFLQELYCQELLMLWVLANTSAAQLAKWQRCMIVVVGRMVLVRLAAITMMFVCHES